MEKANILIVDDDEALVTSLLAILQSEGYAVDASHSGGEAITRTATNPYDLMIVDLELPDMEGTDLLRRLPPHCRDTVKIILTGHPNMDKVVTALFRGVDAYVMKPVSPSELLKIVQKKLSTQSALKPVGDKTIANWIEERAEKI